MKTVVIERERWARGLGGNHGSLRNHEAKMCCLGFVAEQCGVAGANMVGRDMPANLSDEDREKVSVSLPWLFTVYSDGLDNVHNDSCESGALADANDSQRLTDDEREAFISDIFAKHGTKVVFK